MRSSAELDSDIPPAAVLAGMNRDPWNDLSRLICPWMRVGTRPSFPLKTVVDCHFVCSRARRSVGTFLHVHRCEWLGSRDLPLEPNAILQRYPDLLSILALDTNRVLDRAVICACDPVPCQSQTWGRGIIDIHYVPLIGKACTPVELPVERNDAIADTRFADQRLRCRAIPLRVTCLQGKDSRRTRSHL